MASVAVVAATTLLSTGANAAAFGPYNIDGTVPGADAAQTLTDASGNTKELGPKNGSSTKISVIHTAATPMLDLTNPNAQVDLKQAWLNLKRQGGNDFLYFAWERDSNTGSGFIAFEFMKNGLPSGCAVSYAPATCNPWKSGTEAGNVKVGRSAGDFLILWDQSGGSAVLSKRTWTQASADAPLVLSAPVGLPAAQAAGLYSADKTRGEAAINLTLAGLTDGQSCTTFANVIPSTVTGNSDTADYKDTILQKIDPLSSCTPSITTTPTDDEGDDLGGSVSIGSGTAIVRDKAVVGLSGGNATPTGTVTFSLCQVDGTALCEAANAELIGTTNLSGASFPAEALSPRAYITKAGRYCWRSTWSGDSANGIAAVTDNAIGECFVVNPVTPTLTTEASADTNAGGTVSDTATLSGTATQPVGDGISNTPPVGAASAGGSIVFTLYGPSDSGCGDDDAVYASVPADTPVSGDDDYVSPAFEPASVGTYHWVASYSGDGPNTNGVSHNTECDEATEEVNVTDVPSTIETAQTWVPNDSATVSASAGGAMTGTVYFDLYASTDCSGTAIHSESEAVSGASPQTVETSNTDAELASGDYSWQVSYDSDNPAQRDIAATCHETSALTVDNGDPVSSD